MFDIGIWVQILKILGISSLSHEKICKKSLIVFESVEAKIEKMRKSLVDQSNISDNEIEAYHRYLSSLTFLLVENWQKTVLKSLKIIVKQLERILCQETVCLKKIRKSISCCKRVQEECKSGNTLKVNYLGMKAEINVSRIEELQETFIQKYLINYKED